MTRRELFLSFLAAPFVGAVKRMWPWQLWGPPTGCHWTTSVFDDVVDDGPDTFSLEMIDEMVEKAAALTPKGNPTVWYNGQWWTDRNFLDAAAPYRTLDDEGLLRPRHDPVDVLLRDTGSAEELDDLDVLHAEVPARLDS